jgi:hypothetical protein
MPVDVLEQAHVTYEQDRPAMHPQVPKKYITLGLTLPAVCRQIYAETCTIFYAKNIFKFHSIESLLQFTSRTQQGQRQVVEHIHVAVQSFRLRPYMENCPRIYLLSCLEQTLWKDAELASIFSSLRSVTVRTLRPGHWSDPTLVYTSEKELDQMLRAGCGKHLDVTFPVNRVLVLPQRPKITWAWF